MVKIKLKTVRMQHLWIITIIVGIFVFLDTHPIRPQDFWWHITVGKQIVETHSIPNIDIYSYTMNSAPYSSYHMFWFMEIYMYFIYNLGGPALSVFVHSLIITAAYIVIMYIGFFTTGSWRAASLGGIFAAALGMNDWNIRPQSVTFLIGALFLWAIYSYRQKSNLIYLIILPISMLVWVNSHGTFPIGLVLITIWFLDELWTYIRSRSKGSSEIYNVLIPGASLFLTGLVTLANPQGIGVFSYLNIMRGNQIVQNLVVEWAPPNINSLMGGLFYSALLLMGIVWALSPRRPDVFQILSFLIFAILGISTSRGVIWFGLVMAPIFTIHVNSFGKLVSLGNGKIKNRESIYLNYIIVSFLLFLAVITLPWFKEHLPFPPEKAGLISYETPIEATEYLIKENLPPQVFHSMSFGSYLIWAAQPNYKVFVDSRIELYPLSIWEDYLTISTAQGDWENLLTEYGINTLMLSPNEQLSLIREVEKTDNWKLIYQDEVVLLFTKES